ncbi:MAG: DUF4065 domain-containing protein [Clostridia bacterium]|nr:DUF4065 domain-containing protein [Clostridia bacterium]
MAKAEDVAKFMIDILRIKAEHGLDDGMTNLRLQKLMYFVQGYYLAEHDHPLFAEDIEAWKLGPVVPVIYRKYSRFNKDILEDEAPTEFALTSEEKELILDVLSKYGKYSTGYLVELTHTPGAPWAQVFDPGQNKKIDTESIKRYFKTQKKVSTTEEKILQFSQKSYLRGKTGHIILPEDSYEDWKEYVRV